LSAALATDLLRNLNRPTAGYLSTFNHGASVVEAIIARQRVKQWEIVADNLSKAGWIWGPCQPWIAKCQRPKLLTRIAMTVSVTFVRADKKLTAFVELERAIHAFAVEFDRVMAARDLSWR
jgi:hypothetical protein